MKLIDAEKLKAYIASKFVAKRKTKMHYYEDALEVMNMVDKQDEVLLSCPKCHGTGKVEMPIYHIKTEGYTYENRECGMCNGTGKITVDEYEDYQKASREK